MQHALNVFFTVIEQNPVLHTIFYDEESVQLKTLFTELNKPSINEDITALPLVHFLFGQLQNEQSRFDKLRDAKIKQSTETPLRRSHVSIDAMVFHMWNVVLLPAKRYMMQSPPISKS